MVSSAIHWRWYSEHIKPWSSSFPFLCYLFPFVFERCSFYLSLHFDCSWWFPITEILLHVSSCKQFCCPCWFLLSSLFSHCIYPSFPPFWCCLRSSPLSLILIVACSCCFQYYFKGFVGDRFLSLVYWFRSQKYCWWFVNFLWVYFFFFFII